jgi:hypothetical protein
MLADGEFGGNYLSESQIEDVIDGFADNNPNSIKGGNGDDDYSDVPWASAINLTAEEAGYDEDDADDFIDETIALKEAAEAYRNGERDKDKLEKIMEDIYFSNGGSSHQGWSTFMDSVWESTSDLGGGDDDLERSAEDTQVPIKKDGLGSDCGGGSTPNSPLVGPGDRAEKRIGKSFNPMTGRYR